MNDINEPDRRKWAGSPERTSRPIKRSRAEVTNVCSSRKLNDGISATRYPIQSVRVWKRCSRTIDYAITSALRIPCMREHAIASARAGKHLIIEKPIALT